MYKNLLAVFFGLFLILVGFLGLEFGFTLVEKNYDQTSVDVISHLEKLLFPSQQYIREKVYTKYKASPYSLERETSVQTTYTISWDEFSRRVSTPLFEKDKKPEYAIFLGGSLIFGDGISDHETLPYLFNEKSLSYQSYNYSLPGAAANVFLYMLSQRDLSLEVSQQSGIVFYFFQNNHIFRANAHITTMAYTWPTPQYKWESGDRLVLEKGFSIKNYFKSLVAKSFALRKAIRFVDAVNYSQEDFNKTCQLIFQMEQETKRKLVKSKFVVVLYPEESDAKMGECLKSKGVTVIDFSATKRDPELRTHWDGFHPSFEENDKYSDMLIDAVGQVTDN